MKTIINSIFEKIKYISSRSKKQKELDKKFLEMCDSFSILSRCVSWKVACLIVKNNRIISTGVNGSIPGYKNCDEIFDNFNFDREKHHEFSDEFEIHAEMNAIAHAAKNGISIDKSTIYCNVEPCIHCCKNLVMTGITRIVYSNKYDRFSSYYRSKRNNFLLKAGIKFEFIKI